MLEKQNVVSNVVGKIQRIDNIKTKIDCKGQSIIEGNKRKESVGSRDHLFSEETWCPKKKK